MDVAAPSRLGPNAVAAAGAVLFGFMAVAAPALAVGGAIMLGFVALAAVDIASAVAGFVILALLEQVPPVEGSPAVKVFGAVLALVLLRRSRLMRLLRERPLLAWIAIFFVAWAMLSSFWAPSPQAAISSALRLGLGVILVFVVYAAVRETRHVRTLTGAFIAGALITSFIGVVGIQATGGTDAGGRLSGGVGNANELATVLVPAIALAGFLIASSESRRLKILAGVAIAALAFALLSTASRGGLVALTVTLTMAVVFGGSLRKYIITIILAIVGSAVIYFSIAGLPTGAQRFINSESDGGGGRTDIWSVATSIAADRPLFGVGAGNFPIVEPTYAASTINLSQIRLIVDTPKVAHNTYLGLQAELGVLGLLAFLSIVVLALRSGTRAIRASVDAGNRELEFLSRGVLIAVLGLLAGATFGSYEYAKHLWLFVGLLAALPYVASTAAGAQRAGNPAAPSTDPASR